MLHGLDQAKLISAPGPRRFLEFHRQSVLSLLRDYLSSLQATIEALKVVTPNGFDDPELQLDLANNAVSNFLPLAAEHLELSPHLPFGAGMREDLNFMLFRAGQLSLLSREHESLVSVVVDRKLTWSSRSQDLATRPAVAVSVPWVETLTPLRWSLAIHELGHHLLPDGSSAKQWIESLQVEHEWTPAERAAFEEILADAIAERYCGLSYPLALAREGYLFSYAQKAENGLSVKRRIELMESGTTVSHLIPPQWNLGRRSQDDGKDIAVVTAQAMRRLAVERIGPKESVARADFIQGAAALLALDPPEPVAALAPDVPADLRKLLDDLVLEEKPPTEAEATELTRMVVQAPLTDAEILGAAWHNEVDRSAADYLAALELNVDDDDALANAQAELAMQDTWLAQSLQSAAVHRWLESGRKRIEAIRGSN